MAKYSKVSIAIPMQQHSYKTAVGLQRHNLLDKYYTTVYYKSSKLIYKLLNLILPADLNKRMHSRQLPEISDKTLTYSEFLGLIYLFTTKFLFVQKYKAQIQNRLFKSFADNVAKDCKMRGTEIVWGFDSWSLDVFKALERKDVKVVKILDMASTASPTIQRIIREETEKRGPFYKSYELKREMYSDILIKDFVEEFKYADYFLSPSDWVKRSLKSAGISENKILYLPHGVDIDKYQQKVYTPKVDNKPLKFLFVGRVEAAKGIAYLFEVFKQLQDYNIELLVVGDAYTWRDEVDNYSSNIKALGFKRGDEMPQIYQDADVFILSSLWEGSALSMLEAMASGLPVIASSHSCAPDIIDDGVEGFVYDPYNIEALKKYIIWYVNNKQLIKSMGIAARKKAEKNTWNDYFTNVESIITQISNLENDE